MTEYSNQIAELLAIASEKDKAQFAHFLVETLDRDNTTDARMREYVAAFDRFVATRQGS